MDSLLFPHFCTGKNATNLGEGGTFLISRKIVRGVDSERPRSIQSEREVVFFCSFKEEETHQSSGCSRRFCFPSYMREGKYFFFSFLKKAATTSLRYVPHTPTSRNLHIFCSPLPAGNGDEWMDTQTDCTRREKEREGKKPFSSFSFRHRREKSSH